MQLQLSVDNLPSNSAHTPYDVCSVQMLLGNPLGLALGAFISPALAHDTSGDGIDKILLLHFSLALAAAIACLFLSSAPPTAPSATAAYRRGNDNLGRDFKSLRNNFGFLTLFQMFSLAVGALQALLTLMEQILRPKQYTSKDAGSLSATIVLCGILGAGKSFDMSMPSSAGSYM
jgi:hypothetical protein